MQPDSLRSDAARVQQPTSDMMLQIALSDLRAIGEGRSQVLADYTARIILRHIEQLEEQVRRGQA